MTHLVESRQVFSPPEPEQARDPLFFFLRPLLLGALALGQTPSALAVNPERGRQLYENQCQACHSSLLHTKKARKIETLGALQQRVATWGIHAGQDWGSDEVNDVTLYLERAFYHFSDKVR